MNEQDEDNEEREGLPPSRSQRKRDHEALRARVRAIVALPEKSLDALDLDEKFREQVDLARHSKRGALKRQIKHLTNILADRDTDAIEARLDQLSEAHHSNVTAFHRIEGWRDRLLEGDDTVLEILAEKSEHFDRQHARQLVRNARREMAQDRAPASARALHRYLASLPDLI